MENIYCFNTAALLGVGSGPLIVTHISPAAGMSTDVLGPTEWCDENGPTPTRLSCDDWTENGPIAGCDFPMTCDLSIPCDIWLVKGPPPGCAIPDWLSDDCAENVPTPCWTFNRVAGWALKALSVSASPGWAENVPTPSVFDSERCTNATEPLSDSWAWKGTVVSALDVDESAGSGGLDDACEYSGSLELSTDKMKKWEVRIHHA